VQAQSGYRIQRMSPESELGNASITNLSEDSEGFVWVGTENGLYRYDGYLNIRYGYGQAAPYNLQGNKISALGCGPADVGVLVATNRGFNLIRCIDYNNLEINEFSHAKKNFPNFTVNKIIWWEKAKAFVVSGEQYLSIYYPQKNNFITVKRTLGESITEVYIKNEEVLVATKNECQKLEINGDEIILANPYSRGSIFQIDGLSHWAMNRQTGIAVYQSEKLKIENDLQLPIEGEIIQTSAQDKSVWLGFSKAGIVVLKNDGKFETLTYSSKDVESIPSNHITSLITTKQGVVLIGTDYGLCKYDPKQSYIKRFTKPVELIGNERYSLISIYSASNGNIYAGTDKGFDMYSALGPYKKSISIFGSTSITTKVNVICNFTNSIILLGTDKGLVFWDITKEKATKTIRSFSFQNSSIPLNISCLQLENDSILWLGTKSNGLVQLNLKQNTFEYFKRDPSLANSLGSDEITALALSAKKELWVGTSHGLNLYKPKYKDFLKVDCFVELEKALVSDYITAIYPASNGMVWIGTKGGGLVAYDWGNATHSTKNWLSLGGTPITNVNAIIPALNNQIWLAVQNQLVYINAKTYQSEAFDFSDGQVLPIINCGTLNTNQKSIIMAGEGGLVSFLSNELLKNHKKINAYLSSIEINGKKVPNPLLAVFTHETENINLNISAISISEGYKAIFRYKINEQGNWVELPFGARNILLNQLSAGNYKVFIEAKLPGTGYGKTFSYNFAIPYAWYQLWYVKLLAVFIGVAIVLGVFLFRLAYVRNQLKVSQLVNEAALKTSTFERQALELQLQALSAQMNPHFVFNCLNAIQECIVQGDSNTAQIYLSRFAKLLRRVLENQQHSSISLQEELDTLELYLSLEQLRFSNDFSWKFIIDEEIESEDISIPPLLLQPFVENAVWHGLRKKEGKKLIVIHCKLIGELIYIMIADNGIGRKESVQAPPNHKKKSLGLSLTQQRINLFTKTDATYQNTWIVDRDSEHVQGKGTTVIVILPENNNQTKKINLLNSEIENNLASLTQLPLW